MIPRILFAAFVSTLLVVPSFAEDDETPLEAEMSKMSKALKVIGRNAADASAKDANLAKLADAKAAAEKSLTLEPAKTKDIPEAEKAKFIEDYKAGMKEVVKQLDELKVALEGGKAEEVTKVLEKLKVGQKEGHKKFQKEEE